MEAEEHMKTYVAEINGEAIIAFRAKDDDGAYAIVNETDGGLQLGLNGFSGMLRADGSVLWDDETEIKSRRATDEEHAKWVAVRDAETGLAVDGKQIDPTMGDDPDDLNVYLIPIMSVDDDDEDDDDLAAFQRRIMGSEAGYSAKRRAQSSATARDVLEREETSEKYSSGQVEQMMMLFTEVHGRPPRSPEEFIAWTASAEGQRRLALDADTPIANNA
jgi:hypothetical protein